MAFIRNSFSVRALIFTVAVPYHARDSHYTIVQLANSQTRILANFADSHTRKLADSQLAVYLPPNIIHAIFILGFLCSMLDLSCHGELTTGTCSYIHEDLQEFGEHGNKGICVRGIRAQSSKHEGNRTANAISGNRGHNKSKF